MEAQEYYVKEIPKTIKKFEKEFEYARKYLKDKFDEKTLEEIHDETLEGIKEITPQTPPIYLKNKENVMTLMYFPRFIAFYKVLKKRGISAEEYIKIQTHVMYEMLEKYPDVLNHACGKIIQSRFMLDHEKKGAARAHDPELMKEYPQDWIYNMIDDPDPNVKLKYEIPRCTVQIMFDQFDVPELKPYCDYSDILGAKIWKYGYSSEHGTDEQGKFMCSATIFKGTECEIPDHLKDAFEGLEF